MNDAHVFHTLQRPSRGRRLIAAWRGMAQLGMLLDGRMHAWAGDAAARGSDQRESPASGRVARAPRVARLAA
jgi:hypothetical protein